MLSPNVERLAPQSNSARALTTVTANGTIQPTRSHGIMGLLLALNQDHGITVLMVAHEPEANRLMVLPGQRQPGGGGGGGVPEFVLSGPGGLVGILIATVASYVLSSMMAVPYAFDDLDQPAGTRVFCRDWHRVRLLSGATGCADGSDRGTAP